MTASVAWLTVAAVFLGDDPSQDDVYAAALANATAARNLHIKWAETPLLAVPKDVSAQHPDRTEVELWLRHDGAFRQKAVTYRGGVVASEMQTNWDGKLSRHYINREGAPRAAMDAGPQRNKPDMPRLWQFASDPQLVFELREKKLKVGTKQRLGDVSTWELYRLDNANMPGHSMLDVWYLDPGVKFWPRQFRMFAGETPRMQESPSPSSSYAQEIAHEFKKASAGFLPSKIERTASYGTKFYFLLSEEFPTEIEDRALGITPADGTLVRAPAGGGYIAGGKTGEKAARDRVVTRLQNEIQSGGASPVDASVASGAAVYWAVAGASALLIVVGLVLWSRRR